MRKTVLFSFLFAGLQLATQAQNYRLVNPKDNFVSSTDTINFKWSVADSALTYDLQVAADADFLTIVYAVNATASTGAQKILTTGFTYFWRIRSNTANGAQAWSYYRSFSIFNPTQLSGLVMWFDAAKNVTQAGGNISQWGNLSASGLTATQSNASQKPTLVSNCVVNRWCILMALAVWLHLPT